MLLNSPEIRKLESRFISLFQRTFKKGTKGKPASALVKSVKVQFQSATFRTQMDSIIDDIYLQAIGYADEQLQEIGHGASVTVYSSAKKTLIGNVTKNRYNFVNVAAASDPLPITEEAVKQASGLSETVTKSIVKILKEDGLYLEHPNKLEKRIRDLWGGEKYKAVRFARTFTADVAVNTELFRYQDAGIEDLQFYAKIDGKTSDQCRALHGTVFRTDSKEIKQYRPPLHFHCRSDILGIPITRDVDSSARFENRDFSQQMDQSFSFLDETADPKVVDKALADIGTFREKYSIEQFILDEDLELRLQKLNVSVVSDLPGKNTKKEVLASVEDEIRTRTLEDGEKCYLMNRNGRVLLSKTGVKNGIRFTDEELKLFKGKTLTHSHPFAGSFSPEDISVSCYHGLKEMRAAGKYRTYVMKVKKGKDFSPDLWIDKIRPIYNSINLDVRAEFREAIAKGDMSPDQAGLLHWHEVWSRVAEGVPELNYSFIEVKHGK